MSENRIKLSIEHAAAVRGFQAVRDKAALKVGVAAIEFEAIRAQQTKIINNTTALERRTAFDLAREYGIDPEKVHFEFDLGSGEIVYREK